MLYKLLLASLVFLCFACKPMAERAHQESEVIVATNANLELVADSVLLIEFPLTDSLILYKPTNVVVVEHTIVVEDSVEVAWIKVACSQKVQGWLRQSELKEVFIPVHYISQAIHLFSKTYMPYCFVCVALFIIFYLYRVYRKKKIWLVYVNDIESVYPMLFCCVVAVSATLYESVQAFDPHGWQYFFFNPALSPVQPSAWVTAFLLSLWAIVLVGLATLDVVFKRLPLGEAFFYLLGLIAASICGYMFFVLTTRIYLGYFFLLGMFYLLYRRVRVLGFYSYQCGNCGARLKAKGRCGRCGAINR